MLREARHVLIESLTVQVLLEAPRIIEDIDIGPKEFPSSIGDHEVASLVRFGPSLSLPTHRCVILVILVCITSDSVLRRDLARVVSVGATSMFVATTLTHSCRLEA